ncbi:unnamed protein product, partial [Rotaria sp. Silwood2]
YKKDYFCPSQATYAFERQCKIIPLIVLSNYRPDGWLNRIINGKISIDFIKFDFELAKTQLKNEIDRQRKYSKLNQKQNSILIKTPIEISIDNYLIK